MIKDNKNYNEKVKPNTEFLNELKSILPQFFVNEKYDEEGNLVSEGYFDIDKFQESLRDNNINEIKEGYQLSFIGKDYAKKQAGEKPTTVVVPDNKHNQEDINKNSKNLFFTGDNLEVLRHLQNNYRNSIDVVYIDPPYNTGNDGFVYPDSFEYSDEVLQDVFGLNESELSKLKSIQGKSTHSAWLTFMYPRLVLAKKLLSEEGLLYVSIDDNEASNLSLLLSEVFGDGEFIEKYIWQSTFRPDNSSPLTRKNGEFIFLYAKRKSQIKRLIGTVEKSKGLPSLTKSSMKQSTLSFKGDSVNTLLKDGIYKKGHKNSGYILEDDVEVKDGRIITPFCLTGKVIWGQEYLDNQIKNGTKILIKSEGFVPYTEKESTTSAPNKIIPNDIVGDVLEARAEVLNLFKGEAVFSYPKPVSLIKYFLKMSDMKNQKILDFFAGSGTTADAVMQLNAEDGGNRQFIMVQIDEPTYTETDRNTLIARKGSETAFNAGYMSIDEISRERIKRASQKIRDEKGLTLPENFDGGFKHYRIVKPTQASINDLETYDPNTGMFVDSKGMQVAFSESGFDDMIQPFSSEGLGVSGSATGVDTILTTWMIQDGYKLDEEFTAIEIDDYDAFYIDKTRIYLISNGWQSKHTRELLNMIGKYELTVQTIVLYGYSFGLESIRELELGLKQLPNKVNLVKRY
ncbi:site-specific DNA-methyltransferase [Erysipelothrix rhusiopathiae]|uniref:site-specific DNA-methyltransferase n=1 Tax=Erysipelothrix rhusiopathiae TaxID=1648 RepID=UPI000F4355ED|nr:site-specific DNA-methyltransferase [Erysipelothrix rhusiopathiae]AYV35234.1 site-specific DNA-methyltransferase [Erysipelothrix rhusiopathiae]